MSREVRRVPPTWEHPKKPNGHYVPLLKTSYEEMVALRAAYKPEEHGGCPVDDWYGSLDRPRMPHWPDAERTHLQMYESTSEGTPISPVMATPEELAHWLADNKASAFGDMTASYEQWLATCRRGWAPSAIGTRAGVLLSGVEALAVEEKCKGELP
jgi:hypothetical protein